MKKLIALLFAISAITTGFTQSRKIDEARRVMNGTPDDRTVYDERGSKVPGGGSTTSRDESIDRINNEYERKINAVRMNPTLSRAEKERRIRELENQRERKINGIKGNKDYNKSGKGYKKDKNKSNKGKHLGWEKGVGNPHRGEPDDRQRSRDDNDNRKNYSKSKQKNKKK